MSFFLVGSCKFVRLPDKLVRWMVPLWSPLWRTICWSWWERPWKPWERKPLTPNPGGMTGGFGEAVKHRRWVKLIWYWELYLFGAWVLGMELWISGSILIILDWISPKALQYISLTPESAVVNGLHTDEPVWASHHFLVTFTRTDTLCLGNVF